MKNSRRIKRGHPLLDALRSNLNAGSDVQLGQIIGYKPQAICKIRAKRNNISDDFILCIHESVGWPIAQIKELVQLSSRGKNGNKETSKTA